MQSSISNTAETLRVLAEPTRLRILLILGQVPLSVAELTELTGLAQSRVSSHLGRLRRLGLLDEQRQGNFSLQQLRDPIPKTIAGMLPVLREQSQGVELEQDLEAARALQARRQGRPGWAARVAGEMEKHYSPGRGWEVVSRALIPELKLGEVLDIAAGDGVIAELLAPRARRYVCLDIDNTVAAAGRRRLQQAGLDQVPYLQGDMHALPFRDASFSSVVLLNALQYSANAAQVLREAARVLKPQGRVWLATLDAHQHEASVATYDHQNLGFAQSQLDNLLAQAGLSMVDDTVSLSSESRPPFHQVHVLHACLNDA
nr:metalloregulator ArsR/SmtB family transcription factor [Oceanococcus sp. HetDA_MAG_MS8]